MDDTQWKAGGMREQDTEKDRVTAGSTRQTDDTSWRVEGMREQDMERDLTTAGPTRQTGRVTYQTKQKVWGEAEELRTLRR